MITYFNLRKPKSDILLADYESYGKREEVRCPASSEHRARSRRIGPMDVSVKHCRFEERMIWCMAFGTVVHESLLNEFSGQGFTGFRSEPSTVTFGDGTISANYHELIITGWAGVATPASGVRVINSCPACHWKKYYAIRNYENLIDWSQWTGDDFFIVWPMPHSILITERVAFWLLNREVKSFNLTSLDDLDNPTGRNGFTVGRLSNFLPEDLAVKYGRQLDLE